MPEQFHTAYHAGDRMQDDSATGTLSLKARELLGLHHSTLRHKLKVLGLAVDRSLVQDAPES